MKKSTRAQLKRGMMVVKDPGTLEHVTSVDRLWELFVERGAEIQDLKARLHAEVRDLRTQRDELAEALRVLRELGALLRRLSPRTVEAGGEAVKTQIAWMIERGTKRSRWLDPSTTTTRRRGCIQREFDRVLSIYDGHQEKRHSAYLNLTRRFDSGELRVVKVTLTWEVKP